MANRESCRLSLLTAYRARPRHLEVLLDRLDGVRRNEGAVDFELILVEGSPRPTASTALRRHDWVSYAFVEMPGAFNKARLLNRAASLAAGDYLMPLDVDLLPGPGVLPGHLSLAERSPACLLSGYRIQLPRMPDRGGAWHRESIRDELRKADIGLICAEDRHPRALIGRLLDGRRFGVCPCFPSGVFRALGGYHEGYIGWGAEDQDLVERACGLGLYLVRCYDLLYLHMPHPTDEVGWREGPLTAANRELYHSRRKQWAPEPHV